MQNVINEVREVFVHRTSTLRILACNWHKWNNLDYLCVTLKDNQIVSKSEL